MKRVVCVCLAVVCLAFAFSCSKKSGKAVDQTDKSGKVEVKVGLLCIGDENDQGYSYNFVQGRKEATERLRKEGINVSWVTKYNIKEDSSCADANIEAAEEGCKIIINNSYGHEDYMLEVAPKYPDVQFVSCTNQKSHISPMRNVHNAFASIYEGRYVAGVVAGMKLNEMIEKGVIRPNQAVIGYVGAYSFAEVISGFSAYYLGARSVCPSVTMKVTFVGSWGDATAEADAAASLADKGAVMISQHSDNTTPATTAQRKNVFHTGYNADMTKVAPSASLISTRIDWSVYFYEIIKAFVEGREIPKDWCKGMKDGAVVMTALNKSIAAPGTEAAMNKAISDISSGKLQVFDLSKFTIGGTIPENKVMYDSFAAVKEDAIVDGAFRESYTQSAPYFVGKIDGIEWLNEVY